MGKIIKNGIEYSGSSGISALDVYPIGSIYMSVNSTSPATLFGGTWEQLKDMFLLGSGDTYTTGATGGEATHTLTVDEMPSHTHSGSFFSGMTDTCGCADDGSVRVPYTSAIKYSSVGSTGGGQAHNNMPPYLVVNMWKRTA